MTASADARARGNAMQPGSGGGASGPGLGLSWLKKVNSRLCPLQESSRVAPGSEGVEKMSTDTIAGSATDTLSTRRVALRRALAVKEG